MVRLEIGFLTGPSCAASLCAALSASVTCTCATSAAVRPAAGGLPRMARGARRASSSPRLVALATTLAPYLFAVTLCLANCEFVLRQERLGAELGFGAGLWRLRLTC